MSPQTKMRLLRARRTTMINVSPEAIERFRVMRDHQEDQTLVIKLYVRNVEGQIRYGMSWAPPDENDTIVENEGVSLYLEELSLPFLNGAEIGYIVEDLRQGFSIRAPAGMGGGCGGGGCGGGCSCGARQ